MFFPRFFLDNAVVSLHTFCDASKIADTTVCYLRVECCGEVSVNFVQAKSRATPARADDNARHSIPRLELLASTIGLRLSKSISDALSKRGVESYYWSDLATVLSWIHREGNWDTFVYNRVKEIRNFSKPDQWRHVPGDLNPADLPSRGCDVKQLVNSRWWEGPDWLCKGPEEWPSYELICDEREINKELRKSPRPALTNDCLTLVAASSEIDIVERFSSYSKLVKVVAWIKRFGENLKKKRVNVKVVNFYC